MRNIQPGMNVAKQRRKLEQLARDVPPDHQEYIDYLILCFDAEVAAGTPIPASEFIPRYHEEFGIAITDQSDN